MITEAARAGFVSKSAHGQLPRLQIATIEDILEGKLPDMPRIPRPASELIPRRKITSRDQLELLMPVDNEEAPLVKGDFIDPRFMNFGPEKRSAKDIAP
jgi:site-specific DNA-methyltransferase (adenine-specific)